MNGVRTLDLGLFVQGWTLINWLVLILNFRDAESANFVPWCRTRQSEPFGVSPLLAIRPCASRNASMITTQFPVLARRV